jgi:hypothetical protein
MITHIMYNKQTGERKTYPDTEVGRKLMHAFVTDISKSNGWRYMVTVSQGEPCHDVA